MIPNVSHQEGRCKAHVQHLAGKGVQIMIAGGMGQRPLMGFSKLGIEVFRGTGVQTVGQAITALIQGRLPKFSQQFACSGGCEHPQ